tara:strand:+ start:655 stop:870 length:216 start_codon:yes stop_codon:yes gene_type:complete
MPLDLPINFANEKLPPVSEELILWLKGVYPDRMPDDEEMGIIRYKQGQQSVVRTLTSIYEELRDVSVSTKT